MDKTDDMNKGLSIAICAVLWTLLFVAQSFMLASSNPSTPNFWSEPRLYYAVWLVDLYLIILYYCNYHFIAAAMIRAKQYLAYGLLVLVAMLIALFIPILCYKLWGWTIPTAAEDSTPLFAEAMVWALALMALGLAIRSVKEWIRLSDLSKSNQQRLADHDHTIAQLQTELMRAKAQLAAKPQNVSEEQGPEIGTFENLSSHS